MAKRRGGAGQSATDRARQGRTGAGAHVRGVQRASVKTDAERVKTRREKAGVETGAKPTRPSPVMRQSIALTEDGPSSARSETESDVEAESDVETETWSSRTKAPPFLVAAIGASAGGLVAFSTLLRKMPEDVQLALVLVQHLAPDHRSMLPELLAATCKMKVETGADDVPIQPNHVYVIPPNAHMTVADGHLRVRPRPYPRFGTEGPVDALFRSVASEYREHAVGVVLSGSANDGAVGIREIKEVGGITMAQAPEEAEIDGMPRAAIATGTVDVVLPVADIAEQLVRLSAHPFFRQQGEALQLELELPTVAEERRRIFQLLRRETGVDFNKYKTPTIARRIQRRMALHRVSSLSDYVARIEHEPKELQRLHEDLLIHVTSFFRDPDSFAALTQAALSRTAEERGEFPLRAWVPGCSTGEEVYSLAVSLIEALGDRSDARPLQIFGTDVSEATIDRARAGVYPAGIAADVSPERLRRFFQPFDGGFRINKAVRDCCVFARQDVTRDPPFSRLDLVVCRNLLIYLTQPTQRKVMSIFHYALKPNGILMLGRSETIGANADLFGVLDKKRQLYTRKPGRVQPVVEFAAPPQFPSRLTSSAQADSKSSLRGVAAWDPQADANRFLLDRYAPPAVIVDASLRVVRSRGGTSPFLELPSGDVSLDILKMVRPELLFGLRTVLHEARLTGKPVSRDGMRFKVDGEARGLTLHVAPLGTADRRQFLVLFEESDRVGATRRREKGRRPRTEAPVALTELQQELVETRQQLQAIIDDLAAANEELQSANEEILSSNEELQSTNEELDTAKEELQSTNEELSTVNDEMQGRNEELSRANSDLVNLLANVQIPIVMVGADLRIRRFTPAAEQMLNIIASDVGRPISHIKPNFSSADLESLIAEVIATVSVREREVETRDGRLLTLQVRPYQTAANQIDGAVLVLFDVSVARNAAAALKVARLSVDAIASAVREPILQLNASLTVDKTNRAFCDRFQVSSSDIEGRSVFEMDDGGWDIPSLHQLIEQLLPEKGHVDGFVVEHDFPRLGRQRLLIDARHIAANAQRSGLTLLIIRNGDHDG